MTPLKQIPTPRTDAELIRFSQFDNAFVNEHVARDLERKLTLAREALEYILGDPTTFLRNTAIEKALKALGA